jgi:hypothetical protein
MALVPPFLILRAHYKVDKTNGTEGVLDKEEPTTYKAAMESSDPKAAMEP